LQIDRGNRPDDLGRRWPWVLLAAVVVALLVGGSIWLLLQAPHVSLFRDREALQAFLDQQGARAPLALMALQAAQVLVAPIPGHFLAVASGMLFGLWQGTLYTVLGVGVGSAMAIGLARLAGRPLVGRLVTRRQLARIDHWAASHGPIFFFLFFLIPFLPDDLACFAAGLSPLPVPLLLGIVVVARLPGHFASAWIGATATRLPLAGWVAIIVGAGLLTLLYWRHRRRLERWLIERIQRTGGKGLWTNPADSGDRR